MDFKLQLKVETVAQANPDQPVIANPEDRVDDVLRRMKEHQVGSVLICQDDVLNGIFTERDALKMMASGADLSQAIQQVMVQDPVTLSSQDTVGRAIRLMSSGGYRRLPIVDDAGHPIGILKVSGILHYLVAHFPKFIYTLPPDPHHVIQQREGA